MAGCSPKHSPVPVPVPIPTRTESGFLLGESSPSGFGVAATCQPPSAGPCAEMGATTHVGSLSVWGKVCAGLPAEQAGAGRSRWPGWRQSWSPRRRGPGGLGSMLPWMSGDSSVGPSSQGLAEEPGHPSAHSSLDAVSQPRAYVRTAGRGVPCRLLPENSHPGGSRWLRERPQAWEVGGLTE